MHAEQEIKTKRNSYRAGKYRLKSIRWMLLFVVVVQTVVTTVAGVIASFFPVPPPVWLQMLVIELVAYLVPLSLYTSENRILSVRDNRNKFGLRPIPTRLILLLILAGFGCQFCMILLDLPLSLLFGRSDGYIPGTGWELVAAMVVLALIPAIFEEFLLRGIVYGVMAEMNTRGGMIFITLMFALMHGSVTGFLGYLFLGMILVLVLRYTGSLYGCMLFHLVNNMTALLLSYYSSALMDTPMATLTLFGWGVLAFLVGWVGLYFLALRSRPVKEIKTAEFLGQNFVNLPIILCLICVFGFLFFQG